MFRHFIVILLIIGIVAAIAITLRYLTSQQRTLSRWFDNDRSDRQPMQGTRPPRGWLSQWLYLAGYRAPYAAISFVVATVACGIAGFGTAILMQVSGMQAAMERTVVLVPGGVGETFLPVVCAGR